jgi:CheY-like chemotaxis protein
MRSLLELEGFQVRTVASAQEGREVLDQSTCDLILLDLMMPGMDGFAFLRTLRSDLRYRNLPVVVVTAKDLTREEADELRRNASDVVQKSAAFNQDLKDVLRRLCQPVIVRPPAPTGPAAPNPNRST